MQHKSWETRKERSLLLSCLITFWSRQEPLEKEHELWIWGQTLQISLSFLITVYSYLAVFCLGQFYCHMSAVESLRSLSVSPKRFHWFSTPQVNIGGRWKKAFEILACLWLGKTMISSESCKSLHVNCPKLMLRCCALLWQVHPKLKLKSWWDRSSGMCIKKNVQLKRCARRLSMITMVSEMHPAVVG